MENKPDALAKTTELDQTSGASETMSAQVAELKKYSDALEKRAKNTVDKLEKAKYQQLIDELSKSWDIQSEKVSTGARDLQAELRARITPDQQKLLDETKQGFTNGIGTGNSEIATGAKDLMKKTVTGGEKAVEAIKAGDYSQAKQIAKDISETTNAAGEKVITYAGESGLAKILEPLKQGVVNIFDLLAKLWKFFTGGFTHSDVLAAASEDPKKTLDWAKEKAVETVNKRRDEAWGTLLRANSQYIKVVDPNKTKEFNTAWDQYVSEAKSPNGDGGILIDGSGSFDYRAIFNSEKQSVKNFVKNLKDNKVYLLEANIEYAEAKERIWKHIVASGWISPEDAVTKRDKFEKMMEDKKYQTLLDPLKAVKNNENWNLAEAIGNAGGIGVGFVFDLNRAGVIPLSAIGAYMVNGAVVVGLATTKFLLGHSVDQFVYTVSGQSLEDINARPAEEKRVLMSILYHNMSLQLYMTGLATKMIATAGLMGLYWEQGTGFTAMKWQYENIRGQYDKMSKTLEHLAADTLKPKETESLKAFDQTVRQFIAEKSVQLKLVALYRANPKATPQEFITMLEGKMSSDAEFAKTNKANPQINKDAFIDEVKNPQIAAQQKAYVAEVISRLKSEGAGGLNNALNTIIKTSVKSIDASLTFNWDKKMLWHLKEFFTGADQISVAQAELINANEHFSQTISKWVTEKWTFTGKFLAVVKLLGYGSPAEFIKAADKGQIIINAQNPEAAVKVMQNVVKEIPSGLHNMFFKAFPVAIAVHDSWGADDKFRTFITDVASANPLYWFGFLFMDGWNLKGANLTNPGYLMAAATAGAFTAAELGYIMMHNNRLINLAKFGISPLIMVRDTLGMARRAAQNTYRFARAGTMLADKGNPELWKLVGELAHAKWRAGLVALGMTVATIIPVAAFSYADQKRMWETLAVAEKRWILNPETGLVVAGIKNSWQEWTASQKEDLVRMSSTQILGDNVAACNLDSKTGKIVATIDAPKKTPENWVVGISSAGSIQTWKLAMQSFGLTPEIAYSRNANTYLINQFKDYSEKGVPTAELDKFQKEIEWTIPQQA